MDEEVMHYHWHCLSGDLGCRCRLSSVAVAKIISGRGRFKRFRPFSFLRTAKHERQRFFSPWVGVVCRIMPPAEFIEGWASIIKSIFVALFLHKSRNPQSPRQTWSLDECAQLGSFPLLIKAFSYGAGVGARPVAVFQSPKQMNDIAPNAENIITASAELRTYFGVRDYETASMISKMIGAQTLEYQDEVQVAQARHAKQQAVLAMMNGDDPMQAIFNYAHHKRDAQQSRVMRRILMEPDEILNMPADRMLFFTDGLSKSAYVHRRPYYEQGWMAGRYHPNPYRPPVDEVRVKTLWGRAWRKVIREPVPDRYAHFPQYADGF